MRSELRNLLKIDAHLADEPLEKYRRFVRSYMFADVDQFLLVFPLESHCI